MTQTSQRDIPYHVPPVLFRKKWERRGFREIGHLLLENWLGINLLMGGGE